MYHAKSPLPGLKLFVIGLLVLGIFFRVVNLDRKVYWGDEVYTSIRVSGYTTAEIVQAVTSAPITAGELQKFQRPAADKGLAGTIEGLVREEPQLTPLYFVSLRSWVSWLGDSVTVTRSLSVLFSLLTLPCLYWFCLELFGSATVGLVAIAMVAISPLHLVYAQEARMYSLWILTILFSGATLLRAIRLPTKINWLLHIVANVLALYASFLSIVVLIGYGVYVFLITIRQRRRIFFTYLLSAAVSFLAFLPWLSLFLQHQTSLYSGDGDGSAESLVAALKHWAGILGRGFIDFNFTSASAAPQLALLTVAIVLILILIGYALYFGGRYGANQSRLFLLILIVGVPIALIPRSLSPDIPPRYLIPTYLGIQLAVADLLATKLTNSTHWRQQGWRAVTVLVMTVGVISGAISSQSEGWWNKQYSNCNAPIARTVNQAPTPLVVSDLAGGIYDHALSNMISLSHRLNPTVAFEILPAESKSLQWFDRFQSVFVLTPSAGLRSSLEQNQAYKLEAIHTDPKGYRDSNVCLWKLTAAR